MNKKILKIALNNILKQKRRSLINALTFSVNTMALIVLLGLLRGMYNKVFENTIDFQTGHFKIYNKNYFKEKRKIPLKYNINNPYKIINEIKSIPYFVEASPRIIKTGLISDTRKKTHVIIQGIDFPREKKIMKIYDNINGEGLKNTNVGEILIGEKLADVMNIKLDESLLLFSQTINKSNNLVDVSVKGIYSTGFEFIDKNIVFIPLKFAQTFFDMEDKATEIIIRIKDKKYVSQVKKKIKNILKKYPDLVLIDWKKEGEAIVAGAQADFISYAIIFTILLFLAIFTVMNTLTITVFERIPEIGTLRAIGLERKHIKIMFLNEAIIISIVGFIIGAILVLPVVYFLNIHGIKMPAEAIAKTGYAMEPIMKGKNEFFDWVVVFFISFFTGILGGILPSLRASKIKIVDALKTGVR